jgi:AraC family transcriptional regulator
MQVKKNIAAEVSDRFRLLAPTGISPVGKSPPLAFSHLRCDRPDHGKSKHVRPEDGYVIHIALGEVADAQLWLNGRDCAIPPLRRGDVLMGHLESDPVIAFHSAFDFVRFYIAKATLDELAEGSGRPRPFGLRRPDHGASDPVLYHLAASAASLLARAPDIDQLLLDHLALAAHAHVVDAYSGLPLDERSSQGGLAAWQERRAKEFIDANLSRNLTLLEIAEQCALSPSHFSRAFRHSTGRPPHRWLLERRVDAAKAMLAGENTPLATVASACGFSDPSHFSRVFSRIAGDTPASWRRIIRC